MSTESQSSGPQPSGPQSSGSRGSGVSDVSDVSGGESGRTHRRRLRRERTRGAERSFRRTLGGTFAVLVVLCGILTGLTLSTGPALASVDLDPTNVVLQPSQRLLMHSTESLAQVEPDQISITPAVPFTAVTQGTTLAITFEQRLRYNTDYRVTVEGVTSPFQDRATDFDHSFTTAGPPVTYLKRSGGDPYAADKANDQIISTGVAEGAPTVVFEAPRIQEYVRVGATYAVSTENADGTSELILVPIGGSDVERIPLPASGTIDQLDSEPTQSLLGFRLNGSDPASGYSNTLFIVDLMQAHKPYPLPGPERTPIQFADWGFVTGSNLLIGASGPELFAYDASLQTGVRLGDYDRVGAVTPNGDFAVIAKGDQVTMMNLREAKFEDIPGTLGDGQVPSGLPLLETGATTAVQAVKLPDTGSGHRDAVVRRTASGTDPIFTADSATARITGLSLSPNDQYLAIELVPNVETAEPDGYHVDGTATSLTTVIVDSATGAIVRTLVGSRIVWP